MVLLAHNLLSWVALTELWTAPKIFTELSGDLTELSGDLTELTGDLTELSGDLTELSGDSGWRVRNCQDIFWNSGGQLRNCRESAGIVWVSYGILGGGTTEFSGILWNCLGISRNSGGWAQEFSGEGYYGTLQSALMEFLWGGGLVLWNSRGNVDCSRGLYGIHQRSDWS